MRPGPNQEWADLNPATGYDRYLQQFEVKPDPPTPARIKALRKMPYREYLETPEWRRKRAEMVRACGYRCALCGRGREHAVRLNVHHKTYERLGCEEYDDLIVICRECHAAEHGIDS